MGLFAEWVMVHSPSVVANPVLEAAGATPCGALDGWALARSDGADPAVLSERVAAGAGAPAIVGWLYDSDFAYLTGAAPDRGSFEIVIGCPYDTGDGDVEGELAQLASSDGRIRSAHALSAWAKKNLRRVVDETEALRVITADHAFAEEGVTEILERLGIADAHALFERLGSR